ncbi:hypothetical protein LTS10_008350 [Elasticomyces elasticus]|nr:hypothetical protein LTS10_008350 [Elasticomyces elasticus]
MAQATPVHRHGGERETDLHGEDENTNDRVTAEVHKLDGSVASEPAQHKTTRCYLLEIPPELRLRIYEYVFDKDVEPWILIWPSGEMRGHYSQCPPKNFSSVVKTCRLVAQEAAPVLYKGRKFIVYVMPDQRASEFTMPSNQHIRPVDTCLWLEQVQIFELFVYAGRTTIADATKTIKSMFVRWHQKQTITYLYISLSGLGEGDADPLYKVLAGLSFSSGIQIRHTLSGLPYMLSYDAVSKEVLERFRQASGDAKHVFTYP